jgi:hypothetical protein
LTEEGRSDGRVEKTYNEGLHDFYYSPSIIRTTKEDEVGGAFSANEGEQKRVKVTGGNARRKETTRETKI